MLCGARALLLPQNIGRSEMLISEFYAAVEAREDGLHPILKAGTTQPGEIADAGGRSKRSESRAGVALHEGAKIIPLFGIRPSG